jgi:type II secretory pathway pseudopilin PulG
MIKFRKFLKSRPHSVTNVLAREDGFTLVGAMVLGVVLLLLIASFASYQYQSNKAAQNQGNRNSYNQMQTNVTNTMGQTETVMQMESLQQQMITPSPTP